MIFKIGVHTIYTGYRFFARHKRKKEWELIEQGYTKAGNYVMMSADDLQRMIQEAANKAASDAIAGVLNLTPAIIAPPINS